MIIVFRLLLGWGGSASGSRSFLAMTTLFSLAGWLLIFLPLVLFLNPGSRLFHPAVFPWVGAAGAVLVFLGWLTWVNGPRGIVPALITFAGFAGYAAVVGLLAGLMYSLSQMWRSSPSSDRSWAPKKEGRRG
jgi:hypothetical protein